MQPQIPAAQHNIKIRCDRDAWMSKPVPQEICHGSKRGVDRFAAFFPRLFSARLLLVREKEET